MMSFVILLLVSLAAMTQVELATAARDITKTKARENALLGLEVALGNLQEQLGPDQRISASPQMLDKSLSDTAPIANWTGTWDARELLEDGTPNPNYGKNIGWLVSGFDQSEANPPQTIPDFTTPFNADGSLTNPTTTAKLVGSGTVDEDTLSDYVAAPKVAIDTTGEYAYWVSDEGRKARVNLSTRQERGIDYPGITPNVQSRMSLSAPGRNNVTMLTGLESFSFENDPELASIVARSWNSNDIGLADSSSSGTTSPWQEAIKKQYHTLSFNSVGLQTDTLHGGLKKDLSLLFELSDEDFAKTPYSGHNFSTEFDDWTNLPPTDNTTLGDPLTYIDPVNNDQVSYLFKERIPRYGQANHYVRGPTWHYLRDFYRLYKEVDNNSTMPTLTMRPFAPDASHFSSNGGQRGYMWTMEADNGGDARFSSNNDNYACTVVMTKTNFLDPVTRLTRHAVMPLLNRVMYVYSIYADEDVPEYKYYAKGEPYPGGTVTEDYGLFYPTGGKTNALALVIEPIVFLWNPYNVAVEFDGGLKIHSENFGGLFSITPELDTASIPINEASDDLSVPRWSTDYSGLSQIMNAGNFQKIDLLIGDSNTKIVLEPGEVRAFTSSENKPISLNQLPQNDKDKYLKLSSGFNTDSGILFGRRSSTYYNYNSHGIIHQLPANSNQYMQIDYLLPWGNYKDDLTWKVSTPANNTFAYVPPSAMNTGGSLITSDTILARYFFQIGRPLDENGKPSGKIIDWLYEKGPFPIVFNPNADVFSKPNKKFPFMVYGLYENPVYPDTNIVNMPTEFIGTMSPFSTNVDAQFSHGGLSTPYTVQLAYTSGYSKIQTDGDKGFFGEGYGSAGETNLVVTELPTYPMRSLASLQHAHISPSAYLPGQAIGNSWACGMFPRSQIIGDAGRNTQYDLSYLSNKALFDEYFFSSLTPKMDLSDETIEVANLEETLTELFENTDTSDSDICLSNERFGFMGSKTKNTSDIITDLIAVDGFSKSAAYFAADGSFNINSTSVEGWEAFLASTLGADYTYLDPENGYANETNGSETIFPRSTLPNGKTTDTWRGPKGLTSTQRHELAQAIVDEIKARGPFMNISSFVNRSISSDDTGKKGAIQAAIDKGLGGGSSAINSNEKYADAYVTTSGTTNKDFIIDNVTPYTGVGTPQYLTQADVLTPLAPYLSARSDTFTIRSYGSVKNEYTNKVESEAWLEVVVQRAPDFVDIQDTPDTQLANLTSNANKTFGRKFIILSARWLNEDDI